MSHVIAPVYNYCYSSVEPLARAVADTAVGRVAAQSFRIYGVPFANFCYLLTKRYFPLVLGISVFIVALQTLLKASDKIKDVFKRKLNFCGKTVNLLDKQKSVKNKDLEPFIDVKVETTALFGKLDSVSYEVTPEKICFTHSKPFILSYSRNGNPRFEKIPAIWSKVYIVELLAKDIASLKVSFYFPESRIYSEKIYDIPLMP